MTLGRLLAASLVICSLPAFAQNQQSQNSSPSTWSSREAFFSYLNRPTAGTSAEPWRIVPTKPADFSSGENALDPTRQYRLDQIKGDPHIRHLQLDALDADTTCYAIRSYVVARDSRDSDSTHPVGYSTCQPSNRYQVRSANIRVESSDR